MTSFDKLEYMLDGEPISANGVIIKAILLDYTYANDGLHTTSEAARILREHGYTVEKNDQT